MEPPVSAMLLAAGSSRRMGQTKQLLPLDDKPVIGCCVDALLAAHISDIVVVVSGPDNGIAAVLRGLPVTLAVNAVPDSDMAESVRSGLPALDRSSSGVLICLSDHPLVKPATILALIAEHRKAPDTIIIPCFDGRRGHPSLFPKKALQELYTAGTLREIVRKDPQRVRTIDRDDEGIVLDMDTPAEYQDIVERVKTKNARQS